MDSGHIELDDLYFENSLMNLGQVLSLFPVNSITDSAKELAQIILDIKNGYSGKIHPELFKLYEKNYHKGIAQLFGEPKPEDKYFDLTGKLKANTSRLAAFKSHHATNALKELDKAGKTFDADAKRVLAKFNRYQAAEHNAIVARSRTAKQFSQFQQEKELYPNMKWIMTRSATPREEHLEYVGIVLPMDDPFWDENQPGNLWNCKCDWETTDEPSTKAPKDIIAPSPGLEGNPAVTGELITDKHPYVANAGKSMKSDVTKFLKEN